jgi:hypothetical protein
MLCSPLGSVVGSKARVNGSGDVRREGGDACGLCAAMLVFSSKAWAAELGFP